MIGDYGEIDVVGHRLVHGGEKFTGSVVITDEVLDVMRACNDLAPLHNPANIVGVEACRELMPDTLMVGVFDTAFNQTMEPKAFLYGPSLPVLREAQDTPLRLPRHQPQVRVPAGGGIYGAAAGPGEDHCLPSGERGQHLRGEVRPGGG